LYKNEETKPENQRVKPKWSPPKPSMKQCILDIIDLIENKQFSKDKFQQGIRKTFISTGTSMQQDGSFVVNKHKNSQGTIKIAPTGTVNKYFNDENELNQQALEILMVNGGDDNFVEEEDQNED
jgi:hypothetical protein